MKKSEFKTLIREVVQEMGKIKDPSKFSPKYKRAKELALTDYQTVLDKTTRIDGSHHKRTGI